MNKKSIKLHLILTFVLGSSLSNASFVDDEINLKDLPAELVTAYKNNDSTIKKYIRTLCLFLYNARNGIAYRDYSRKEKKYGKEETHDLPLDISLVAQENAHSNDIENAAEYCAQIPNPEIDYFSWSKDYAMDFKKSAMTIRYIADELDWDPADTKKIIIAFWKTQRALQQGRKSKPGNSKPSKPKEK